MTTLFWLVLSCIWIRWVILRCLRQFICWKRGKGIRQNFDILSCCMDTFLILWGFSSLLVFRNLYLLIHTSFHFSLFLSLLWFFLWFTYLFVFSPRFFLTLRVFLYFLSPPHCIIMTQYVFQYFLRLAYHKKHYQNSVDAYFCQGDIEETVYYRLFSNHLLLKTHSNQKQDNEKLHPPNPKHPEKNLNE